MYIVEKISRYKCTKRKTVGYADENWANARANLTAVQFLIIMMKQ